MRYAVVIERAGSDLSAYVPDLPGCVATAADTASIDRRIRAAVRLHIEGLRPDGAPIPEPQSVVRYVEVGAPGAGPAVGAAADDDDPPGAFSEWASPIDDQDYADL